MSDTWKIGWQAVLEQLLDALDGIACVVDAESRIVAVGRRRWDRVAAGGGDVGLRADNVIGRSLFDVVLAGEVREACTRRYREVLSTGEPAVIALQCGSLGAARLWRLSMAPLRLVGGRPGLLVQAQTTDGMLDGSLRLPLGVFGFEVPPSVLDQEKGSPAVGLCRFCRRPQRPQSLGADDSLCADCEAARFPEAEPAGIGCAAPAAGFI